MLLRSSPASSHISSNPDIKTIFNLFTEPSRPSQSSCCFAFETPSILVLLRLRDLLNPRAILPLRNCQPSCLLLLRLSILVLLRLRDPHLWTIPSIPLCLPCCLWQYVNVKTVFNFVQAEDELVEDFIRGTILSLYLSFVYFSLAFNHSFLYSL
jgi:hypothetical protein